MFKLLCLVLLAALSIPTAQQDTNQTGTPVPFTQLDPKRPGPRRPFSSNSGILKRMRVAIREQEAWLEIWKQVTSGQLPPPPPPEIDFSREMVIVVAMGQLNTGGNTIMVDGIYEKDRKLEVVVKSTGPGIKCMVTQAFTQPVDIVRLQKSAYPVVFRDVSVTNDCGF